MQLNERERKFITYGGIAWGIVLVIFLIIIPWQEKRKVESARLRLQLDKLKEVKMLVNRKAGLALRESSLIASLMNQKEVRPYAKQIVEIQTMLENIAKSKKVKITDTRPLRTAVIREDLDLRKATIRLTENDEPLIAIGDFLKNQVSQSKGIKGYKLRPEIFFYKEIIILVNS